jgi:Activator of Hsp90 ATPase homolog 1-like protein
VQLEKRQFVPVAPLKGNAGLSDSEEAAPSQAQGVAPFEDWDIVGLAYDFATDPALFGEMTLTATFEAVSGGTEVTLLCENLQPGLRAEDNDAGSRLSLEQLARRFE